jgi:hypothetical protein
MPLDLDKLLLERPTSGSEPFHYIFVDLEASIELWVVPPGGVSIPSFFIGAGDIIILVFW